VLTLEILKKELEPYKNTLVINGLFKISLLVDVIEDEDDYYWVFKSDNQVVHISCLVEWIPLKGFIDSSKYESLVSIWNLNNLDKAN
jgi:hypothetical protein